MANRTWKASLACSAAMVVLGTAGAAAAQQRTFDIPAESAIDSIPEFGRQAGVQITAPDDQLVGVRTPAIKGQRDARQALKELLAGTGLRVISDNGAVIVLHRGGEAASPPAGVGAAAASTQVGELVVTGTNIRGARNIAEPSSTISRSEIDRTGATTLQDFIQQIPQNFGGGATEGTFYSGTGSGGSTVAATGVNLRGLGDGATLVLLDGHRMAPDNNRGDIIDISMIPLSAIQRVDVVPDGSSAIYGSDAVGGVVNLVLRTGFEGGETRASVGGSNEGGGQKYDLAQTLGHSWGSGSALLTYEYLEQHPLSPSGRSYASAAPLPFDLLPPQQRNSVLGAINQDLTSNIQVYANALYSYRVTNTQNAILFTPVIYISNPAKVETYDTTVGSRVNLTGGTQLNLSGTYAATRSDSSETAVLGVNGPSFPEFSYKVKTSILTVDTKLDGPLISIPAGNILYAIGSQYRHETLNYHNELNHDTQATFVASRDVFSGFAELHVPILGPVAGNSGQTRLELSAAARAEQYSDVGFSAVPQVGLAWTVFNGLRLRTTFGKSFQAPTLYSLNPTPTQIFIFPSSIIGGGPNTLNVSGGNAGLKPETATTWTVGFDAQPTIVPGLSMKATYYNIKFSNEIVNPTGFIDYTHLYSYAGELGAKVLNQSPTSTQITALLSDPVFRNIYGVDPTTVGAIFDSRLQNLSILRTDGIDFSVSYATKAGPGLADVGIDGTYVFNLRNRFTVSTPSVDVLDTPYNPIDIKFRGHVSYNVGSITASAFLNYVGSYMDNRVTPSVHIPSWTTVDLSLSYKVPDNVLLLGGTVFVASVANVADENPPFLNNGSWPVNYDGGNANPLGRYFAIALTKRW